MSGTQAYAGRKVVVAGVGVAGAASARALLAAGAAVTVVDQRDSEALCALAAAGADTVVIPQPDATSLAGLFDGVSDVVVSPGFAPSHPIAAAACSAGLDVYSEPELAWRMRGPDAAPWLAVTGTNGKTTTVTMLAAMLRAEGLRTEALGNIGLPLVTATTEDAAAYDALVVELSSFQLHWSRDLAPRYGAILNIADDHLDWHGGAAPYAATKSRIWRGTPGGGVAAGNLDDARVAAALAAAPGRTVGWTLGAPAPGQLGVVDATIVDRAFSEGEALIDIAEIRPAGLHNVSNAIAAATLARAHGVSTLAVRDGLRGYVPQPHRNAVVTTISSVAYVDDSKATNPHAALASMLAYPRIVWVAGGQLKGVDIDDLVIAVAGRLAGAVLLGVDRARIAEALARHARHVPVVEVATTDDGAMREAVRAAAAMAVAGDTVLLAPAAASLDMYASYARRGQAFVEAITDLGSVG